MLVGTVTVFSKTTCKYCKRAKELLSSKALENVHVLQLDELDASVRAWMLEHTEEAKTVPQIFFNDTWIPGGASNLETLQADGLLDAKLAEMLSEPLRSDSPLRSLIKSSQLAAINNALAADADF